MRHISLAFLLLFLVQHASGQAGWTLSQLSSPMDDNSGIVLESKARPGAPSASLTIQCTKRKGLNVVLRTDQVLVTSGNVSDSMHKGSIGGLFSKNSGASLSPVRIRLDQQKATREEWVMGANQSNLFAQKPKRFVDSLLKNEVKTVLLEVRPYNEDAVVFDFNVSNLAQYKTALHDACGY